MDKKKKRASRGIPQIPMNDENNPNITGGQTIEGSSKKMRRVFSGISNNTPLSDITNGTQLLITFWFYLIHSIYIY